MKDQRVTAAWSVLFGTCLAALAVGCSNERAEKKANAAEEQRERLVAELADLAKRYGANADWLKSIDPSGKEVPYLAMASLGEPPIYTADLQRALAADKPVAFRASLVDVARAGESYRLTFAYPDNWTPDIVFQLTAGAEQVGEVLARRPGQGDACAVVAAVRTVKRPLWRMSAYPEGSEEARIDVELADAPFYAEGKCVAVRVPSTAASLPDIE